MLTARYINARSTKVIDGGEPKKQEFSKLEAKFNFRKVINKDNRKEVLGRINDFHTFHTNHTTFHVKHYAKTTPKFDISALRKRDMDLILLLDLNQVKEYILTGEQNDFFRKYQDNMKTRKN